MVSKILVIILFILSSLLIILFTVVCNNNNDNFDNNQPLYYEGLLTESLNKKPQLEATGLGDRILRWHASSAIAKALNKKIIIPILELNGNDQQTWKHSISNIENIKKIIKIPEGVEFVKYSPDKYIPYTKINIKEKNMYESAENFWKSVPRSIQKLISKNKYENAIKEVQFLPKIKSNYNYPYLVLHIRQGDESFDSYENVKNIINELQQLNYPIVIMSDSIEHKNEVIKLLENTKLTVLNKSSEQLKNYKDELAKDYSILFYSKGIISITKRGYSALPYCVSAQTGTPIIFYPKIDLIKPKNNSIPSKNIIKSFKDFKKLIQRNS